MIVYCARKWGYFVTQNGNVELNRGFKEYNAKIKNLEGILNKLEKIINVTEYQEELKQIQMLVNAETSLSNEMISESMKLEYEDIVLNPYVNKLDNLLKKIKEQELESFYELHLLTYRLNSQISNINNVNITEIIEKTKELINLINSLNAHNDIHKNKLITEAYKTVYSVILYEEIFNRNDILTYIKTLNIPANIENLGRFLTEDLKILNKSELIDEDLQAIRTEGLGYDYLSEDIIKKISRRTVGESNSKYQERKNQAIAEITSKVKNFSTQENYLSENLNNTNAVIRRLNIKKSILITKTLSLALIPIMTFCAGKSLGKNLSNKITEYLTITRTIDLNTGKTIGTPTEVYDEKETTYVATIMECSAWRQNPTGAGYIRNVTAYEYTVPENTPSDYHITIEDIKENIIEKYKYVESKENLETNDSTIDPTILVTETYQDKKINKPSTKYIIPLTIVGAGVGIAIDTVLILFANFGLLRTKELLDELNEEIGNKKLNKTEIKTKLKEMQEQVISLQEEYNNVVKNYGNLRDSLIIPEIDESWLDSFTKRKTKK